MARELHPTQEQLLELLSKHIDDPLTFRDMQAKLGASSTSVIAYHLKQLEKKGYLIRNPSDPRDYHVLSGEPEKRIAYLGVYGLVHCGPRGSILDSNPIDRIPIPTKLLSFPSKDAFLVKAKGNSMIPKIGDGDLVIAKKADYGERGRIVVCINEGEALIKKLEKDKNDNEILVSTNSQYRPLLAAKDFRVVGEVKGVFSQNID